MNESTILLFLLTSLLIILSPGQDLVLVISRSIAHGRHAGMLTAAGVSVGLMGHTLLAALGLGALLQTSELLFSALKFIGAAYLIHLGIKAYRAPSLALPQAVGAVPVGARRLFVQGMLSNLSNPKIAVFYFAYLPQFISPGSASPTLLLLALGSAFAVLTFAVKVPIGFVAGVCSNWFQQRPTVQRWMNRVSGTVLISLGLKLAAEHSPGGGG